MLSRGQSALVGWVVLVGALGSRGAGAAEPLPQPRPLAEPLELQTCIQIALQRQPALAAYRASQAAAEIGASSLQNLRVPTFLARDLPYRRQQACLGVVIARAKVLQAELETTYAVTRTYLSVLYARQQHAMLVQAVEALRERQKEAKEILDKGLRRDLTERTLQRIAVYEQVAESRRHEAEEGINRARAALREAMGVGPDFPLEVAGELAFVPFEVEREQIVELALTRRPELVQASNAAAVVALEVPAQHARCRTQVQTFAAGSDLHANPVPQGSSNGDYRPGAVGLEMPPNLVGSRKARVERARAYQARAEAVVEKTRNLIALEAEDAYFKWLELSRKAAQLRQAAESAERLAEDIRQDYRNMRGPTTYEDALNARVLASQLRAQATEALYQYNLAVAALVRVTADDSRTCH
jgi:outer membrane protein TolC